MRCWFCRHDPNQIHDPALARKLDQLFTALATINSKLEKILMTEQDILDKVTAEKTVDDSILALLAKLSQMVKDAGTDPVKLQAISDLLDKRDADLAQAVVDNTPAQ